MKKIILILGPTASGKSSLAIELAQKNNGEIISIDSRQIFKEIPKFSGATTKDEQKNIKHYLIGSENLNNRKNINASFFEKKTNEYIEKILDKNKTPILVGGSSFFFEPIIFKNFLVEVKPDLELRKEIEKKSKEELLEIIKENDLTFYNKVDKNNKVRLVRAVEIISKLGKVPKLKKELKEDYFFEFYFLLPERIENKEKIKNNFRNRFELLIEEAEKLRSNFSASEIKNLGLAYKYIFDFWEKKINKEKFFDLGLLEEQKYAKRQMTYLKKLLKEIKSQKTDNFKIIEKKNF